MQGRDKHNVDVKACVQCARRCIKLNWHKCVDDSDEYKSSACSDVLSVLVLLRNGKMRENNPITRRRSFIFCHSAGSQSVQMQDGNGCVNSIDPKVEKIAHALGPSSTQKKRKKT